ncbi:tRNA (adenosine(37)-N6)-threonylcarbamoyltransferase complex ATPase subunit type 1 TsaE [Patescibacteria group bacterium]|nr:tRNA (adenosine(37)-N6)-threonylcarbamoyltransferase complex ATPase subunit type 1 TsaE [Patescibacteria group bacterium]
MVKFFKKIKKFKILTKTPYQTKKLGKILAGEFLKTSRKRALVFGLIGDLGGGKTTFLQGFAKGLKIKEKILSPTFVIMKKFKIQHPASKRGPRKWEGGGWVGVQYLIHIDCYRIKKPKEILNLGFKEIISDPKNIVTIEWADRIRTILPKSTILIKFNFIDKHTRKITLKYTG